MSATLIKNARVVNEGTITETDLRIVDQRIEKIEADITAQPSDNVVDAKGAYLLPGMIDDQVHFREPGLTHKGSIATESRAAVAGGITSYMEMPNVNPATTTIEAFKGHEFTSRIKNTWINGGLVYASDSLIDVQTPAMRMSFAR